MGKPERGTETSESRSADERTGGLQCVYSVRDASASNEAVAPRPCNSRGRAVAPSHAHPRPPPRGVRSVADAPTCRFAVCEHSRRTVAGGTHRFGAGPSTHREGEQQDEPNEWGLHDEQHGRLRLGHDDRKGRDGQDDAGREQSPRSMRGRGPAASACLPRTTPSRNQRSADSIRTTRNSTCGPRVAATTSEPTADVSARPLAAETPGRATRAGRRRFRQSTSAGRSATRTGGCGRRFDRFSAQ